MLTRRACLPYRIVPIHDRLQNAGKRSHSDACCYENGVFCSKDMAGRCSVWTVNCNLTKVDITMFYILSLFFKDTLPKVRRVTEFDQYLDENFGGLNWWLMDVISVS